MITIIFFQFFGECKWITLGCEKHNLLVFQLKQRCLWKTREELVTQLYDFSGKIRILALLN